MTPVLGNGHYVDSLPLFGGLSIWEANPRIVQALRDAGTLLRVQRYKHPYMHCWRHKTPIIYRATNQWFAGMDVTPLDGGSSLRERACLLYKSDAADEMRGVGLGGRRSIKKKTS